MELKNLSSNWKQLQKTLKVQKQTSDKQDSSSLKRKRTTDGHANGSHAHTNGVKVFKSRKKFKMEEPPSIGASKKHDQGLLHSISTPNLKTSASALLKDPAVTAEPISVLTPSPHHPDIENEGVSSTALPGKYVAVDCEMVGIGPEPDRDSQLARVSLVNYHGHQVYDSYVLPVVPVTDYRTKVSGILPKHLEPSSARPFQEVQKDVATILQGRILVGHAIKNDLSCLILSHPKRDIRDTCRHQAFRNLSAGKTPALKKLVKELLGVEFQTGMHNSVQDSRATMALFRLEKDEFEREAVKKYGRPVAEATEEVEDGEKKKRKRKKKKKKAKN